MLVLVPCTPFFKTNLRYLTSLRLESVSISFKLVFEMHHKEDLAKA